MSTPIFEVNTHEIAVHVNRLDKMHRSALPNAVRGTLNGMAFDVKQNTMPKEATRTFENRDKNFFKAKSRVDPAKGWNVDQMRSTVGFVGNEQAVEDLEQQERGGIIKGRAFIPTKQARTGTSNSKKVAKRNQMKQIRNVVRVSDAKGKTPAQKYVKSAIHVGVGGYLLRGEQLLRVKSLKRVNNNRWDIKTEFIYTYKRGRSIKVKRTAFMSRASELSGKKGIDIFIKEAERQFNRLR